MDWNAVAVGIVIAVFVSVSLNILEKHVNAQRSKQIALVPIVKCPTQTKCARDMESANAISVNVKAHILENFVRAHRGMKRLIRSVSFMRHVYNVLLSVNSSMSVPITKKSVRRLKIQRSINLSFTMISQVSRFSCFMMNSFGDKGKGWTIFLILNNLVTLIV